MDNGTDLVPSHCHIRGMDSMASEWLSAFGTGGRPGEPGLMEEHDMYRPHV